MSGAGSTPPGAPPPAPGAVEHLRTTECWRLVDDAGLCRLAVERSDGSPRVFPMNYLVHEGGVYLRTSQGGRLGAIATRPAIALAVDGEEAGYHWTVVIRGSAKRLAADADAALLAIVVLRLVATHPARSHDVVRVTPHTISGRRFRVVHEQAPGDAVGR